MKYYDYDKVNDILSIHFGNETKETVELFCGNLLLDFGNKGEVVGFEIYNFMEEMKKSSDKMRKRLKENSK